MINRIFGNGEGFDENKASILSAEAFLVKAPGGETRGFFGVVEDNVGIALFDGQSRVRCAIKSNYDGYSTIECFGDDRKTRFGLKVERDGTPVLLMRDSDGNNRIQLALEDNSPFIMFLDEKGAPRFQVNLSQEGQPAIALVSSDGKPMLVLSLDQTDSGQIEINVKRDGKVMRIRLPQ